MEPDQASLGLEEIGRVLRRRLPWIVACVVIFGGAAFAYSKHETKKYTATAAIAFGSNPLSQQIAGLSSNGGNNAVAQQDSNLELVRLGDMASKTAAVLGSGLTAEKVDESIKVGVKGETDVIELSATSSSPTLASDIANTYTREFVAEQQQVNRAFLKSALAQVDKQLAELPRAERFGSDASDLQQRAHTLRFLAGLGYNNAEIAQVAPVPSSQSSPKTKRNTLLGAILGLLVGLAVAFLLERFDRRIREPEELETIYGLPLLGTIPKSAALLRSEDLPPAEAEVFSLVRAHLRFFNVDRQLRRVMVVSAEAGDGKSTIARQLADAAARSGSRVILLEADLRRPTLAKQLGIDSGPGLAAVLIGAAPLADATRSVELRPAPGEGHAQRTFDVVTAGAVLPPNPGELLEGSTMTHVLESARWNAYDLVIIDTPPLGAVSDAFPLLAQVDGVVVVGRIGHSHRDSAQRLQQVLASSGAALLGIVANESQSVAKYPYAGSGDTSSALAALNGVGQSSQVAPDVTS